jgi:plastocyanin
MRSKTLFLSALILLLLGLVACGDDGSEATSTSETATEAPPEQSGGNAPPPSGGAVRAAKVEIADFAYDPDPVEVEEGGKVIWINRDAAPHTATAEDGSFDTGVLEEGKLKSESFKEPGTYPYVCSIHPEMHGTVEVVASD